MNDLTSTVSSDSKNEPLLQSKDLSTRLLIKFSSYFNGVLNDFALLNKKRFSLILSKNSQPKPFLIVARQFYKEVSKQYPVDSIPELKKILNLEFRDCTHIRYRIWKVEDGKANVNIWYFNDNVPMAWCTIPETLLYALTLDDGDILTTKTNDNVIFTSVLNQNVYSATHSSLINSAKQFALASGIYFAKSIDSSELGQQQSIKLLLQGMKKLNFSLLSSFFKRAVNIDKLRVVQLISMPLVTVTSIYLLATSAYIEYNYRGLEKRFSNQSAQVSEALSEQTVLEQRINRHKLLADFLSTQINSTPAWVAILELFSSAQIRNIQSSADRIILRGITSDSLLLLEKLTNNPLVQEAKFDFPTQKNRNMDLFVLSFAINHEAVKHIDSENGIK